MDDHREWQRISRRTLFTGAAAAAAAGLVATQLDASAQPARTSSSTRALDQGSGGTLTYGLGFDVDDTLDPQVTNFDSTIRVTLNVCEPLVWMPTATDIKPALAESWDVSADGTEYTFHLRQGATFHDGTPFNAAAVKFTYDRVVALGLQSAAAVAAGTPAAAVPTADPTKVITPGQSHDQIGPYESSEVIDDYTIKMKLTRPFSPFLTGLNGYLGIVSPTAVESMGLVEFARKPVGTGPFKVAEWVDHDHITLEKNADYNWGSTAVFTNGGPALLDKIEYKIVADRATKTGALISGEMQYIDDVDPLQLDDLKSNPDLEVIEKGQPGSGWILLFNVDREGKPQMDQKVRQALSYAVDKNAFNEAVFGGTNVPAASPLMKPTFGYEPKTESVYSFDTAKAEQMLDEAGWVKNGDTREKDGQKMSFYWPIQDRENDRNMATFIQGAWKPLGIEVVVEPMERGAAREKRVAGDYDISFLWFSFADPDILRAIFHSSNIGAFNFARYSNPDIDKMLDDASASSDPEVRKQLYSQIQLKLLDDAVTIPLADSITYNAKQKKLQGEILDFLASYVWMNDAHFT